MSKYTDKELDDLDIVENLQDDKSSMQKQKVNILFLVLLFTAVIAYILYSTFKPKEENKIIKKQKIVHIEKKQFTPPLIEKPVVTQKVLPISPFSKPEKKKVPLKVNKHKRGSAIVFNSSSNLRRNNTNQIDSSLNDSTSSVSNQTSSISADKKVAMYIGGDYAVAGINKHNPNLSIAKGMYIECTMITRIVSSYGGNTKCVLNEDIYSVNGVTLLLEKGSIATGHFKGGDIDNGVERLYVIWDEVRTPNNIVIDLKSHGTGNLGATGLDGYVDNHWGMRFASAVLVSILDIGLDTLDQKINRNRSSGGVNYSITGSEVETMSTMALRKFIDIKPTFYKNHGDVIGIYVEKDLDFSKVYRLK